MHRSILTVLLAVIFCWALPASNQLAAGVPGDHDGDGIADSIDNCIVVYNPGQADANADHVGDACDYSAAGKGDVRISFNGGRDKLYIGRDNIMEIWIANSEPLLGMSIGFSFSSASGNFSWVTPYGNRPTAPAKYVQEEGDALNNFDLGFLKFAHTLSGNETLPFQFLMGGAAMTADMGGRPLPAHPGHKLCYTLKLRVPADQLETADGFCVDNIFFPPAGRWKFDPGNGGYAPSYFGNPNVSSENPDAPQFCFDIAYPHGDANADLELNLTDAVFLIDYIFSGGPAPAPLPAGDGNCDGLIDISDAVFLIVYMFLDGPPPCE